MKINTKVVYAVGFVVLVLLLALVYYIDVTQNTSTSYSYFVVHGKRFNITYKATNLAQWQIGLMNKTITNSTTMLFVFPSNSYYPFWMYDTYTNLDMMWLQANGSTGRVVYLVRNATPCFNKSQCTTYNPTATATYVIEAKAGFANLNNVTVGTTVSFG